MTGKTLSTLVAATLGFAATASAAVNYPGGPYIQTFDGLPSGGNRINTGRGPFDLNDLAVWNNGVGTTGSDGWTGSNFGGSSLDTELRAQDGSLSGSAGRGIVSFGTTGSGERALGALPTSNQVSRFGVALTNTSADTYVGIDLRFIGEQWRAGDVNISNTLSFSYSTSALDINDNAAFTSDPSFNFASPNLTGGNAALDGNLPANQQALAGSIGGLNWAPGTTLTLRWTMNEVSGQDTALAIDNVSISGVVPEPGAMSMLGLASASLLARRRVSR